jgi:hypothetical protein
MVQVSGKWKNVKGSQQAFWLTNFKINISDCEGENSIHVNQLTVLEVADKAGISIGSSHTILTEDLEMQHVSAKLVARILTSPKPPKSEQ